MYLYKKNGNSLLATGALLIIIGLTACSSDSDSPSAPINQNNTDSTPSLNDTVSTADTTSTTSTSDNTDNSTRPAASFDGSDFPVTNPDDFIVLESNGINVQMPIPDASNIDFEFVELDFSTELPSVSIRMTNNSEQTIFNTGCSVIASKDGEVKDTALIFPGQLAYLRPGDTAIDTGNWFDLSDLIDIDNASVSCSWLNADETNANPLIVFELKEYLTDELSNPIVVAQLTNNAEYAIFSASCDYVARKGQEILTYATLDFNDLNTVAPGEAFTTESPFNDPVEGFDAFDSDEFNVNDLYCSYQRG